MKDKQAKGTSMEGFRLFVPHDPKCFYRGEYETCFVLHRGLDFSRDRIGRRRGPYTWHVFRCNDPDCPAEAGVRWDVLAAFIAKGLAADDPNPQRGGIPLDD